MRRHFPLYFLSALLLALAACDQQQAPLTSLTISGLDPCVDRVSVNIRQDGRNENRTAPAAGGSVTVDVGSIVNPGQPLEVTVRVLTAKNTGECAERNLRGLEYRFSGSLPAPDAQGGRTLSALSMTRSRATRVDRLGETRGGEAPSVRNRGNGSSTIVMWTEPADGANCTRTGWEQWVMVQLFVIENGVEKELRNGQLFLDPNTGRPQTFGRFGRDIPEGSTGNCYREDPIPNVPGRQGIVDAPGLAVTVELARQTFNAGRADATGDIFTVSYRFTVRSVLICEEPPPRSTLGYYRWNVTQDWAFSLNPDGTRRSETTYRVDPPAWQPGAAGLEPGITVP